MMNEKVGFSSAPKKYRKIKTVSKMLSGTQGVMTSHDVTVYLCQAGSPTFVVSVPHEYGHAWSNHRSREYERYCSLRINEGWLHANTFDEVLKNLEEMSFNYQRHYESITIKKVIQIGLVLVAPKAGLTHNKPSFDSSRTLVGIRSGVFWEVNGVLYVDSRRPWQHDEDDGEYDAQADPTYDQLSNAGRHASGTVIPFTQQAWDTICEVEATLERAAVMLHKLTDKSAAQLMLEEGAAALLGYSDIKP